MDSYELKRGSGTIRLQKSDHLVGLRIPAFTTIQEVLPSVSQGMQCTDLGKVLGGFNMVDIKDSIGIETALDQLREHDLVDKGSHVFHTPNSKVPYMPTGRLAVRFQSDTNDDEKQKILDRYQLLIVETRPASADGTRPETYILAVTPSSPNPLKVAHELQQIGAIALAEPDLSTPGKLAEFELPADPLFREQWHLQNTGVQYGSRLGLKEGADARVVQSWRWLESFGDPDCIVAFIDDGFDLTHPDLAGEDKIVAPWDFGSQSPDPSPRNETFFSGDYHGTACAGLAIGRVNGTGVVGVAPGCKWMPVRWGGHLNDDSIRAWFRYVTERGAWVVNCSWGAADPNYLPSTLQNEDISDCVRNGRAGSGCVVVFAAGNEDRDIAGGFASHPDVIAVAASTSRDERADYSNFGANICVCAPSDGQGGCGLLTSDVGGTVVVEGRETYAGYARGDFTRTFGGTSGAAALVTGVCALALTANSSLTPSQVKSLLEMTARKIGRGEDYRDGHSIFHGYGCVNSEAVINLIKGTPI